MWKSLLAGTKTAKWRPALAPPLEGHAKRSSIVLKSSRIANDRCIRALGGDEPRLVERLVHAAGVDRVRRDSDGTPQETTTQVRRLTIHVRPLPRPQ